MFNSLTSTLKYNVYILSCLSLILSVRLNEFYNPVLMEKIDFIKNLPTCRGILEKTIPTCRKFENKPILIVRTYVCKNITNYFFFSCLPCVLCNIFAKLSHFKQPIFHGDSSFSFEKLWITFHLRSKKMKILQKL